MVGKSIPQRPHSKNLIIPASVWTTLMTLRPRQKITPAQVLTFSHISAAINDLLWKCATTDSGVRSERQLRFMRGPIPAISNNDSHVRELFLMAQGYFVHRHIFGDIPQNYACVSVSTLIITLIVQIKTISLSCH